MNPIIMTLIFALVMLMFMAFPAIKIVEWIEERRVLSKEKKNILTIVITIILSLIIAIFLQFS
jgi:hypothetical protein